jgi:toxin ParE1/3/4
MASVTWREPALDDVEDIRRRIARDSPQSAEAFVNRIFAATDRLELFPRSGRVVSGAERDDLREIFVHGYRVIYRIIDDEVEVVGVRHGARRLGDIPGV